MWCLVDALTLPPPPLSQVRSSVPEVHLWRLPWRSQGGELTRRAWADFLTPAERAGLARLVNPLDRARRAAGRGFLRGVVGYYQGVAAAQVPLAVDAFGRLSLVNSLGEARARFEEEREATGTVPVAPLEFSLSYAQDWVVLACTRWGRLGVDVERIGEELEDAWVREVFSPRELTAWAALPAPWRREAGYAVWTRKEAYLKALGVGLTREPKRVSVSVRPHEPARLLDDLDDVTACARWSLADVAFDDEHRLALAVAGVKSAKILRFQLEAEPPAWVK